MKRATALFSLISLTILFLAPAYGQSIAVEKPDLPQSYESWQYKLSHSCSNLKETVWAEVYQETKTLEYLSIFKINGMVISYEHAIGDKKEQLYGVAYLLDNSNTKWLRMYVLEDIEYFDFLNAQDKKLLKSGLDLNAYVGCSANFINEFGDFINGLFEKLN